MMTDLNTLTTSQLCAISIHELWGAKMDAGKFFSAVQGPIFPLHPLCPVASALINTDWRGVKKIMGPCDMVTLEAAKQNTCYRQLLQSLTKAGKLKLDFPGQVPFFPVQHCRGCGLVNANEFRLCVECQDEPGYPDPNYFCSERCETLILNKCHIEEHASYVMEKLGL